MPLRTFAFRQGRLSIFEVGRSKAIEDIHRTLGVGQCLGSLPLPHQGFGEVAAVLANHFQAAHLFRQGQRLTGQCFSLRPVLPVQRQLRQIAGAGSHALGVPDARATRSASQ